MAPTTRQNPSIAFGLLLLALTLLAYFVPYYDWDLVAYVGSAIALREPDTKLIQQRAYAALRNQLPEDDYSEITSGSDFRRDVAHNADHFRQQLRFYQIRPLYLWALAGLHAIGIEYVQATRAISVVAFLFIGIVLRYWLGRYIGNLQADICALLLLLAPVLFTSARTGSPDALSALIVLLGPFCLAEHHAELTGIVLLLVSLLLRTDNVFFVVLLCALTTMGRAERKTRIVTSIAAVIAIGIVLTINLAEHSYRWSILIQNTASPMVNPAEVSPRISMSDYFAAVHDMVDEARENSVAVFPFIAAVALFASGTPSELKQLVKIVLVSWAMHIVLYPHIEDRYFIAGAAMIGVAVAGGLSRGVKPSVR